MESMPQIPLNTGEKHIACVVLVDTSGSMNESGAINELNAGLQALANALHQDLTASGCADVAVVSFNASVSVVSPFMPAASFEAPTLQARGMTSMNEAIITGLDLLEERKMVYRQFGTPYYRPWMFLLTDGIPTDDEYQSAAIQRLNEAIADKKVNFFPMAVGSGADIQRLKLYNNGGHVYKASVNNFKEAFVWLSSSMSVIGSSDPSQTKVDLPPMPPVITVEV